MDTWMKVTLAATVPALSFLVLNDTVQGFYGPNRELPLSYVVVEPDEAEEVEQTDVVEAPVSEPADTDMAVAEEELVQEEVAAAPEEAVVEEDAPVAEDVVIAEPVDEAEPAAEDGEVVLAGALTPEEMSAGESAARACASCHQLARDRNAVGPHLVGLAGRTIGSVEGFRYSDALLALNEEGAVWDAASLEAWLEDPDGFAEGTKMMFNVRDAEDRRLIAGWLMQREE